MSLFEEVVESKIEDPRGELTHLIKFTRGEAKELVKHCIQQPRKFCYENAKALTRKTYGDPDKILTAYIDKKLRSGQLLHTESFSIS